MNILYSLTGDSVRKVIVAPINDTLLATQTEAVHVHPDPQAGGNTVERIVSQYLLNLIGIASQTVLMPS